MPAGQGAMKAAKTRLFRIMKNPTIVAGIAFGLGSIAQLLLGNYFAALATGLFSAVCCSPISPLTQLRPV